jgi:phosphoribosylformylglycinamidine synthase
MYTRALPASERAVERFSLHALGDEALERLSAERLLALSRREMQAIRDYYANDRVREERRACGVPEEALDCELEMLAQTWSEHCKHKIFQARIDYRENGRARQIDGLFDRYIKGTTEQVSAERPDVLSVFHDNAGVVRFDEDYVLCFKAETHNSPSALDPYGGAITGIVGVNRDILGTGKSAKPLFNTDVLCFGYPQMPPDELPGGFLHPRTILDGVHKGIVDGGNQSGIPTVAGAVLFDRSFAGKPLVFCGTGGLLPASINGEASWETEIRPGDRAVMVGGRIGKDGIHGATFSSLALDEASPTSAVQIGDPITQRKMTDFLMEARDRALFRAITDNGAGGLSSSFGEMAELAGGIRLDLERCPLKYPGLAPWEIFVSESQERMSLAVPPDCVAQLCALAEKHGTEATDIGVFTDSGRIDVRYDGEPVCYLDLDFVHHGLPRMELAARWDDLPPQPRTDAEAAAGRQQAEMLAGADLEGMLLAVLADPNVASKEYLVRQYDHEVQGHSVGKPFVGTGSGPSDGAVITPRYDSYRGVTVTHGICPRYSDLDTYHMAMCAVDEAMRAHVALGGDPDQASALDNFCWPDPVESADTPDGAYKLGQLVRACQGLQEACLAYRLPLISGKDSMKNDARMQGVKVSVRPTLLISLCGIVPDIRRSQSSEFKRAGDRIYMIGETRDELGGSVAEALAARDAGVELDAAGTDVRAARASVPRVEPETALERYRGLFRAISDGVVESVHDLADGGLGVAVAEAALGGGGLGAELDLDAIPRAGTMSHAAILFSETPSRFLVSVREDRADTFEAHFAGQEIAWIGATSEEPKIRLTAGAERVAHVGTEALAAAWGQLNALLSGEGGSHE